MVLTKQETKRLPATLARSPKKAQETYLHTLVSAEEQHGDGEAAHRIALASLKHSFEKVGDHWEAKAHRPVRRRGGAGPRRLVGSMPSQPKPTCSSWHDGSTSPAGRG